MKRDENISKNYRHIYLECSSNPDISNLEDSQIYYFDFPNYKVDDLTKYVDIINKRKKDYVSGAE